MQLNGAFLKQLIKIAGENNILINEPMSRHTTFKIGGPADALITPENENQLIELLRLCATNGVPVTIIGNGSNLLVSDYGIDGVVIETTTLKHIIIEGTKLTALCGARLAVVAMQASQQELSGLEFAAGIPGTVGGAVYMNAGAYDGQMKDVVETVRTCDYWGNIIEHSRGEHGFDYRHSRYMEGEHIILSAVMHLKKGNAADIKEKMRDLAARRRNKQPLDMPSAGSAFKRPPGQFAAKLIQEAELKGFSVGGAQVSEKHCGFIINSGEATCKDVIELINEIKDRVYKNSGIYIEQEIKLIGRGSY